MPEARYAASAHRGTIATFVTTELNVQGSLVDMSVHLSGSYIDRFRVDGYVRLCNSAYKFGEEVHSAAYHAFHISQIVLKENNGLKKINGHK